MDENVSLLESDVLSSIKLRESLIERLSYVAKMSHSIKLKHMAIASREIVNLSNNLREVGLSCVQRIVSWALLKASDDINDANLKSPPIFLWNGTDYLAKMITDLDFAVRDLTPSLVSHGGFSICDPLFIRKGKKSTDNSTRRAAVAATLVILDAVSRRESMDAALKHAKRRSTTEEKSEDNIEEMAAPIPFPRMLTMKRTMTMDRRALAAAVSESKNDSPNKKTGQQQLTETDLSADAEFRGGGGSSYRIMGPIGAGRHTRVFECERQDGLRCAVKSFDVTDQQKYQSVMRELSILRNLPRHNSIVPILEIAREDLDGNIYIVMEKMNFTLSQTPIDRIPVPPDHTPSPHIPSSGNNASNSLGRKQSSPFLAKRRASLSPLQTQSIAASILLQLLDGLAFLHSHNIIHNDIRPSNILIRPLMASPHLHHSEQGYALGYDNLHLMLGGGFVAKITDFEHAQVVTDGYSEDTEFPSHRKSLWYLAPEKLANGRGCGAGVDIWALGCSIYELITGMLFAEGGDEQEVLDSILSYHTLIPYAVHRSLEQRGLVVSFKKTHRDLALEMSVFSGTFRHKLQSMLELSAEERGAPAELKEGLRELIT